MNRQSINRNKISGSIDEHKKYIQSQNQLALFTYMQDLSEIKYKFKTN